MTASASGDDKFPVDCPDCKAPSGFPYMAGSVRGQTGLIRVGMRCRSCKHEWSLDLTSGVASAFGTESSQT